LPIPLKVRIGAGGSAGFGKLLTCGSGEEEREKEQFVHVIHHRQSPTELDVYVSFPVKISLIMM
jgi:hypothetical protein